MPLAYTLDQFELLTLVVFRVTGLFLAAPLFGSRDVPKTVKLGLGLLTALLVFPAVSIPAAALPRELGGFVLFAAAELAIGVTAGFAATMLFSVFQLAGQHVAQQMGIAMADVIDPFSETEVSVLGQFQYFLALAVYVGIGAHRWLLAAVAESFASIPVGAFRPTPALVGLLSDSFGGIFALSFQVAAPVLVALMLSTVALGFVARAVPQMNVLLLSFPIQIGLGIGVMIWTLPSFVCVVADLCGGLTGDVGRLMAAAAG